MQPSILILISTVSVQSIFGDTSKASRRAFCGAACVEIAFCGAACVENISPCRVYL